MSGAETIRAGRAALGIELGSTRIKACLVDADDPATVLAAGGHAWENSVRDGLWTYTLDDVWEGVRAAYAQLVAGAESRHGESPATLASIGVSAMMHGYLAFDAAGDLLVPFRTWRNTNTGAAAAELSRLFGVNIPLRWSIAHLRQAVLDAEPHAPYVAHLTTLAGYVHWRLTGERVLGVGDASGMFPVDSATCDYDQALLDRYDALSGSPSAGLRALLPEVRPAGAPAGALTAEGATLLDPTGALSPGIPFCPPEGDAGTGMVATGAVAPRTGNVSAGTSIFAMVVLEHPLSRVAEEIDVVTTPAGDPVAMVHCNNGASELAAWAGVFADFARAFGTSLDDDAIFDVLLQEALRGEPDAGGLLAYNLVAGEPLLGLADGRPIVVRAPGSRLNLANMMRAQLYSAFGALSIGMRLLAAEDVQLDRMYAHGGMFRTAGVAQRFLAAALGVPVAVGGTAAEGGAWGMAVLAAYLHRSEDLATYLADTVLPAAPLTVVDPQPEDAAGFSVYLDRYRAGLTVAATAVTALPAREGTR